MYCKFMLWFMACLQYLAMKKICVVLYRTLTSAGNKNTKKIRHVFKRLLVH